MRFIVNICQEEQANLPSLSKSFTNCSKVLIFLLGNHICFEFFDINIFKLGKHTENKIFVLLSFVLSFVSVNYNELAEHIAGTFVVSLINLRDPQIKTIICARRQERLPLNQLHQN